MQNGIILVLSNVDSVFLDKIIDLLHRDSVIAWIFTRIRTALVLVWRQIITEVEMMRITARSD